VGTSKGFKGSHNKPTGCGSSGAYTWSLMTKKKKKKKAADHFTVTTPRENKKLPPKI
jgi:hypothetical protein